MNRFLDKYTPPGYDYYGGMIAFAIILSIEFFMSFKFVYSFQNALDGLYEYRYGRKILIPDVTITSINDLLSRSMLGFWVLLIFVILISISHYASFKDPSQSIYVMKRLPDANEIHRRCLVLPLIYLSIGLLLVIVMTGIYVFSYYHMTPAQCLPPYEPLNIWRMFL